MGDYSIPPLILNLGTRWRSEAGCLTPEKAARCPLNKTLDVSQSQSGRFGEGRQTTDTRMINQA
jgi:hypothetical protein